MDLGLRLVSIFFLLQMCICDCYGCVLIFMVLISSCYSLVLRNGIEYFTKDLRCFDHLCSVIKLEIGEYKKIYCDTFQLYYVGRTLNWEQYRLASKNISSFDEIMKNVDFEYYITEESKITEKKNRILKENGFAFYKKITPFNLANVSYIQKILKEKNRLGSYGPYYLYRKDDAKKHLY